jgi:hypothetical protein
VAETPPAAARPAARRSPVRMVKTREEDKWFEDEEKGYHKGRSFIVRELMIFYNDHQLNNRRKLSYGLAICMHGRTEISHLRRAVNQWFCCAK